MAWTLQSSTFCDKLRYLIGVDFSGAPFFTCFRGVDSGGSDRTAAVVANLHTTGTVTFPGTTYNGLPYSGISVAANSGFRFGAPGGTPDVVEDNRPWGGVGWGTYGVITSGLGAASADAKYLSGYTYTVQDRGRMQRFDSAHGTFPSGFAFFSEGFIADPGDSFVGLLAIRFSTSGSPNYDATTHKIVPGSSSVTNNSGTIGQGAAGYMYIIGNDDLGGGLTAHPFGGSWHWIFAGLDTITQGELEALAADPLGVLFGAAVSAGGNLSRRRFGNVRYAGLPSPVNTF